LKAEVGLYLIRPTPKFDSRFQGSLACSDRWFESHRAHGWFAVVSVVSCQVGSLRRANHSFRGVLPNAMRRCVWSRVLVNEAMAQWGAVASKERKKKVYLTTIIVGALVSYCHWST